MSAQHAQYVLLFLVLAVNSDKFQNLQIELHALTQATPSYVHLRAISILATFQGRPGNETSDVQISKIDS